MIHGDTETQRLLDAIGWSRNYAALRLGVTKAQIRYWAAGVNSRGNPSPTPAWVIAILLRIRDAMNTAERAFWDELQAKL